MKEIGNLKLDLSLNIKVGWNRPTMSSTSSVKSRSWNDISTLYWNSFLSSSSIQLFRCVKQEKKFYHLGSFLSWRGTPFFKTFSFMCSEHHSWNGEIFQVKAFHKKNSFAAFYSKIKRLHFLESCKCLFKLFSSKNILPQKKLQSCRTEEKFNNIPAFTFVLGDL